MIVSVEIQGKNNREEAFGTARAAINWVKTQKDKALIRLDGHLAYKFESGKLFWNNGSSFEQL